MTFMTDYGWFTTSTKERNVERQVSRETLIISLEYLVAVGGTFALCLSRISIFKYRERGTFRIMRECELPQLPTQWLASVGMTITIDGRLLISRIQELCLIVPKWHLRPRASWWMIATIWQSIRGRISYFKAYANWGITEESSRESYSHPIRFNDL